MKVTAKEDIGDMLLNRSCSRLIFISSCISILEDLREEKKHKIGMSGESKAVNGKTLDP